MSGLAAFLHPKYTQATAEIIISDRFCDESGQPVKFVLRTLTQDELQSIVRRSTRDVDVGGRKVRELDREQHLDRCLLASCIYPDFAAKELCDQYGTADPVEVPRKMLLVAEYERLARAFLDLNGLTGDSPELGEITKK